MLVVFFMAGITVHRSVFIAFICMAVFAWNLDMLVPKPVASCVMIEPHVLPVSIGVAVCAGDSQLSFVFVVFLVAAVAIGWGIAILGLGFMACLAFDLLRVCVSASDREVRSLMVESLLRNWGDVLCPTLMFCVAFLAFALLFEPPVVALLLLDILASFFMAVQTERCLGRLVESLMTLGAGLLPLGMALDYLPRHEGGFNALRPGIASEERPKSQSDEYNVAKEDLHNCWSGSIHVDGDDVKNGTCCQKKDQWDVENVPEREKAFVHSEFGDSFSFPEVTVDEVNGLRHVFAELRVPTGLQSFA